MPFTFWMKITSWFIIQTSMRVDLIPVCPQTAPETFVSRTFLPDDGKRGYPYGKYPALKIARLAVQHDYQRKKIGSCILDEVMTIIIRLSDYVGCRILTVDAKNNPGSIHFYEKYGFHIATTQRSGITLPMYIDFHQALTPNDWNFSFILLVWDCFL